MMVRAWVRKPLFIPVFSLGILGASALASVSLPYFAQMPGGPQNLISKADLAHALKESAASKTLPAQMQLQVRGKTREAHLEYSFDAELQKVMSDLFEKYRPDYGAFVAVDPKTGRVLSMVSYGPSQKASNLALRATFPSASVFKVVTAAAAIDEKKLEADSLIPFNGRNHTLYRSNITRDRMTRWTRFMTLKEAFGKSVNTVFGKIGAYLVGPEGLRTYADRFGFNRVIDADLPVQAGKAPIPDATDPFLLAEAASGFTRENRMSPLQGALIAAAIANDGVMMEPYAVQKVRTADGKDIYQAKPTVQDRAVAPETAAEIRSLMKQTVLSGTSKKAFRGFFRGKYAGLDVGGKTGSLTGDDPVGKYDWFVGYAMAGDSRIAVAALTIHQRYWKVKSSTLARFAFEKYFSSPSTLSPSAFQ